jgi:hypothetical protein
LIVIGISLSIAKLVIRRRLMLCDPNRQGVSSCALVDRGDLRECIQKNPGS